MVVKAIEKQVTHRVKQALRMRSSAEVHIGGKRDHKLTREIQICYGEVVMQKKAWLPVKIISLLLVLLAVPRTASAYYTNMPASVVVGQPDFSSGSANQGGIATAHTLQVPKGMVICSGKLVIADSLNNRVLIFNSVPTTNNASADVVIGQADFGSVSANQGGSAGPNTLNSPTGVSCADGKLLVGDRSNNRILIFNSVPTTNNASADVVIGQADFGSTSINQGGSCSANTLNAGADLMPFMYGNQLFVPDMNNNRVLIWNSLPTTNNESADLVLGQADFTSCNSNRSGLPGANTMRQPRFVFYNGHKLLVSEYQNRVLLFNSLPSTNGAEADVVIGQADFSSVSANQGGNANANTLSSPKGVIIEDNRLIIADQNNMRVLIWNQIPTVNNASADVVLGQNNFDSNSANQGGAPASNTFSSPQYVFYHDGKLLVSDYSNHRVLIFDESSSLSTPGFTVNYPPENIADSKLRLNGNVLIGKGQYGLYNLENLKVSINNQGFTDLSHKSSRSHSDHETITEFYHDFEPWAGVAPRNQWTEGDGFTAHFRATSYQSRIETQEAFLFWPFTLDSVNADSAVPVFSFHMPSKNVEHIKSNLDRFEVYIGKEGNFTKYLSRVPVNLVGEDGGVIVSADSEGVQKAQATFLPGEYEVKVRAVDKWGNHFDSNAVPLTLTQALVSVESTPLFSGFWFPLQINRATGINTGIISSFRPESVRASYTTTTLTPTFTGIAFADSLITMTVVNNQNSDEAKTFTTTTSPDSTWSLTPTLYLDSTVSISAQKAGLSASLSLPIRFAASN